jgi:hypothetical protein
MAVNDPRKGDIARTREKNARRPGEWAMPDPLIEEDESAAAREAAGFTEGPALPPVDASDNLTPATLIGDHREGRWVRREGEER